MRLSQTQRDTNKRIERIRALMAEFFGTVVFFMMLASTLGPIGPLSVMVSTVALLWLGRAKAYRWRKLALFLLLPSWAVLSTAWSPGPMLTARYSVQLLITFIAVLAMVQALSPRQFVRALLWSALMVCVISIVIGTKGPSAKGLVLIGLPGSKNAMATVAYYLMIAGGMTLLDRGQAGIARFVGFISLPLAIYVIASTEASGTLIVAVAAPVLAVVLAGLRSLPQKSKVPLFLISLALMSPLVFYMNEVADGVTEYALTALEKDRTLTGRTLMWDAAKYQFSQSPVLGTGYRYFWMSYSPDAVAALHSQNVDNAGAFNFHNTYYEFAADLGAIGVMICAITLYGSLFLTAFHALFRPGIFWIGSTVFNVTMIMKSFGETLIQAFGLSGPLVFAFGAYGLIALATPLPEADKPYRWRRRYARNVA